MELNSSLKEKLQRMKESKQIEEFMKSLTAFDCLAGVEVSQFPHSLSQAIAAASKTHTPRQSKIACTEQRADIFAWVERMFIESGVSADRFYLSTPFRFFPWLDCRVIDAGWVQNLSDLRDLDFSVISHDKTVFLSIGNEEHWLDAYWCDLQ
jgi:hypothetical protein